MEKEKHYPPRTSHYPIQLGTFGLWAHQQDNDDDSGRLFSEFTPPWCMDPVLDTFVAAEYNHPTWGDGRVFQYNRCTEE